MSVYLGSLLYRPARQIVSLDHPGLLPWRGVYIVCFYVQHSLRNKTTTIIIIGLRDLSANVLIS